MLRSGLALLLVILGSTTAAAQTESATSLARPPIRGTRYQAAAATQPTSPTTPPTSLPPPPTADTSPLPTPSATMDGATVFAIPAEFGSDHVRSRMLVLDQHLASLGARRTSNIGGGVVSTLLGGTYIGLGVYANRNGSPGIARYLFLSGSASLVNAGLDFALSSNTERAYAEFGVIRDDPTLSDGERLRRSEAILHRLARRRMAARFSQGGLNLVVAAVSVPFLLGDDGFDRGDAFDWIVTASAAISVVDAVMTMVQRTEEERRWRMYQQFAAGHGGDAALAVLPRLRLRGIAVSPIPRGGFAGASFIF